jgi:DNA-binding transcriptional LysR family regulator
VELRHLRHFVAVAEQLHFARAAERLGMEQSLLSQSIRNLEGELRIRLFHRTFRKTTLTSAG